MIGICSNCGNIAELHDGLCCICKMEQDIENEKITKVAETALKNAVRKITRTQKESSTVVKEGE